RDLEDHGLVERREDPGDRRRTVVALSPATARRVRAWLNRRSKPLEQALAALDTNERAAFLKGLGALADALMEGSACGPQRPDDLVARLEGKSSLGRLGLLIHSTAGFIDPGWDGHVTLELSNVANLPITIYHAMKIGQISFMQLTEATSTPYGASSLGSKYQG